jgi:glyoxylase-like metal-dependent hydrolase (beta-lactamase superfamily II)
MEPKMAENLVWTIGEISITRLVESESHKPPDQPMFAQATPEVLRRLDWLFPHYCTPEGGMKFSIHALLVQTPERRIVIDTCVGNDKRRSIPHFNLRKTDFVERMRAIGWAPESVDAVVCTHMHLDHVGWNTIEVDGRWVPTFPNARYYFARSEYENALAEIEAGPGSTGHHSIDADAVMSDSIRPVFEAELAVLVETNAEIARGVRLVPTPGHTPAHVSVVLESLGECAIITGDMMHHPAQLAHPDWSHALDWSAEVSSNTRAAFVKQFANTPTLVIGTHFSAPSAGYIARNTRGHYLAERRADAGSYEPPLRSRHLVMMGLPRFFGR